MPWLRKNTVVLNQHHFLGLDFTSFLPESELKCKKLDSPKGVLGTATES